MRNLKILITLLFLSFTGMEAQAQGWGPFGGMFGGRGYGGGRPMHMYPGPGGGMLSQMRSAQRLTMESKQYGLGTDCTDYGQGDCAERMARSGRHPGWMITGEGQRGMGWGRGPGFAPGYGGGRRVVMWGEQRSWGGYGGGHVQPRPQPQMNPLQQNFAACSPFLEKDNFKVNGEVIFQSVWGGNGTLCIRPDPMRNTSVFVTISREDYAILLAQAREAAPDSLHVNWKQVNWIKKRIHDEAVAQRLVSPQQHTAAAPMMEGE